MNVREFQPAAAGLIRAALANDTFASERIVAAVDERGQDGLCFALILASLAGQILADECGSKAQAVALVDDWISTAARVCVREAA